MNTPSGSSDEEEYFELAEDSQNALVKRLVKLDSRFRQFLPELEVQLSEEGITVGVSKTDEMPLSIDSSTSFRILIAGASGTGKSFLANRVVNKAVECGFRVVVLDIRGEYRNCYMANRGHAQHLMPGEIPKGMPNTAQFIPEFCKKDMKAGEIRSEKTRAQFFSLSPSQFPPHSLRRLLALRDTDPGYFLLEKALSKLPSTSEYTLNDLKDTIEGLKLGKEVSSAERTKKVLLNKIEVMEDRKVLSNGFFDFAKAFDDYNIIFNFMYAEDEHLRETYVGVIVSNLYKYAKRRAGKSQILLVVDEADLFLNRRSWDESKKELLKMIKLARLFNISTAFISQTPALLPDLILSQSNYLLIGAIRDSEDASELCKSRGLDPRLYKNQFINQDFGRHEFVFMDDRSKGRIRHIYTKSCLSKHEEPFKR